MNGSVIGYAIALGMVALINPCGFPLLPAYLSVFIGDPEPRAVARVAAGLRAGVGMTVGFVVVFGLAGLAVGVLHAVILAVAPWLMIAVGVAIAAVGVMTLIGRRPGVHATVPFRRGRGFTAMAGFGAAYAVGSLSCSLPVFVAAVGGAVARSSVAAAVAVLGFGVGMGLLATALAVVASFAGAAVLRGLRRVGRVLPRIAGAVCVVVGVYLIAYWIAQVGGPDVLGPVRAGVDAVQADLADVLQATGGLIAPAVAVLLLAALVVSARRAGARRRAIPRPPISEPAPHGPREDRR